MRTIIINCLLALLLWSCSHNESVKTTDIEQLEPNLSEFIKSDDWFWPISTSKASTYLFESNLKALIPSRQGAHIQAVHDGVVHYIGEASKEILDSLELDFDFPEASSDLLMLILSHRIVGLDASVFTLYINIQAPLVSLGQRVTKRQALAQVASGRFFHRFNYPEGTLVIGQSKPGELIFEARYKGENIDLELFFAGISTQSN